MIILEQLYNTLINAIQFYGLPGYFIAMIVQSSVLPLPTEALLLLGGTSFGFLAGGLVGSLAETIGAGISFQISRKLGRPVAKRFLGENVFSFTDEWFHTYGAKAVLLGRIIPVIPFHPISFGAGLTKMKFQKFMIITGLATLPRSLFYSALGSLVASEIARQGFQNAFNQIIIIGAILIAILLVLHKKVMKKMSGKTRKKV